MSAGWAIWGIASILPELNANALRNWIKQFVDLDRSRITLICQSFGFTAYRWMPIWCSMSAVCPTLLRYQLGR